MSVPTARDAAVRRLVLTAIGALLLAVVPPGVLGGTPVWSVFGGPGPTPALVLGLVCVLAAWLYFSLLVFMRRGSRGLVGHLPLVVDSLGLLAFGVATALGLTYTAVGALLAAATVQLIVAPLCKGRPRMVLPSEG